MSTVNPIGHVSGAGAATQTSPLNNSSINEQDFIKLLLSELTYQDPLQPMNNTQFLAQLAQFANLEQTSQTNSNMQTLLLMNSTAQSVSLIGRNVEVVGAQGTINGKVTEVTFVSSGPQLSITQADGSVVTGVGLSQVHLIKQ